MLDNVDEDVFDHPVNPTLLYEYLSNPSNALVVATIEAQVIGMATGIAYVHPDKPRSLFVNEVGVSGRHHRRGIGKQLVSAILKWGLSVWHRQNIESVLNPAMLGDRAAVRPRRPFHFS